LRKIIKRTLAAAVVSLIPSALYAQGFTSIGPETMQNTGVSAIWILANISFAGMRAQNSSSTVWRVLTFIFGLPGTILTFLVVQEGSERAYGVELPTNDSRDE